MQLRNPQDSGAIAGRNRLIATAQSRLQRSNSRLQSRRNSTAARPSGAQNGEGDRSGVRAINKVRGRPDCHRRRYNGGTQPLVGMKDRMRGRATKAKRACVDDLHMVGSRIVEPGEVLARCRGTGCLRAQERVRGGIRTHQ